jgi:exonuclease VII small subunit
MKKLTRIDLVKESLEKAVTELEEALEKVRDNPLLRERIEKTLERAKETLEVVREISEQD